MMQIDDVDNIKIYLDLCRSDWVMSEQITRVFVPEQISKGFFVSDGERLPLQE